VKILAPLLLLILATAATHAQTAADPLGLGPLGDTRPPGAKTEITAQREATFDEKRNVAIFLGDVRVTDPSFLLSSDKLTIELTKDRTGIARALAEGNVVIVQQSSGDDRERAATGRAQRAEYLPAEGRATLSGNPQIQQGINRHIATSPSTRMILHRDGSATTQGPSRTVITDNTGPSLP
jgi:lipopolysaccharide transport protein LptA